MARLWPHRDQAPRPPALWEVFCVEWLHLSRTKMEQWWLSLTRSRWSRATELRQLVQLHADIDHSWRQVEQLYRGAMGPEELVSTIEDLIK